eukprot:10978500-Alexandrium_andersonii.AAC.1
MSCDSRGKLARPPLDRRVEARQIGLPVLCEAELGNDRPGGRAQQLPALERAPGVDHGKQRVPLRRH